MGDPERADDARAAGAGAAVPGASDDTRHATGARRTFLVGIGAAVTTITALTVGQTLTPLGGIAIFAPRKKGYGPQAVPVNKTAKQAKVTDLARASDWTLTVANGDRSSVLDLAALRRMTQRTVDLPIACVEGWSQMATWSGVRLVDLLDLVDAPHDRDIRISSLQPRGGYRNTIMQPSYARDPSTTVALDLGGEPLDLDHGYPARMIAPGRPGVLQTKWLKSIEVMS